MGAKRMDPLKIPLLHAFEHLFHFVGREVNEHRSAVRTGKRIFRSGERVKQCLDFVGTQMMIRLDRPLAGHRHRQPISQFLNRYVSTLNQLMNDIFD